MQGIGFRTRAFANETVEQNWCAIPNDARTNSIAFSNYKSATYIRVRESLPK